VYVFQNIIIVSEVIGTSHCLILIFDFQAADLLNHPHLQPYVLEVQSKSSPTRNIFPDKLPTRHETNKIACSDDEDNWKPQYIKSHSFKVQRIVKLDSAAANHDPPESTRTPKDCPEFRNQPIDQLSVQVTKKVVEEAIHDKYSKLTRSPAPTPRRASSTPRRRLEPAKTFHARTANREEVCSICPYFTAYFVDPSQWISLIM
jgi:NIMA (never in mitosis gene a)-related kinase